MKTAEEARKQIESSESNLNRALREAQTEKYQAMKKMGSLSLNGIDITRELYSSEKNINGWGSIRYHGGKYIGEIKEGEPHGCGTQYENRGMIVSYRGWFKRGKKNGYGEVKSRNRNSFKGFFKEDE